jgi:hypothetical protein
MLQLRNTVVTRSLVKVSRVPRLGAGHGGCDVAAILTGERSGRADVGSVNWEQCNYVSEHTTKAVKRKISGPPMVLGEAVELTCKHVLLARHQGTHDQPLAVNHFRETFDLAGESRIEILEPALVCGLCEEPIEVVEKFVARCPMDGDPKPKN